MVPLSEARARAPEPEHGEVRVALRFDPRSVESYFERARSPESFLKAVESALGEALDEWEKKVLEHAWQSIALGVTPFMEVYPITTADAYVKSYTNELLMHTENVKSLFDKKIQSCVELYGKLPSLAESGRLDEVAQLVRECRKLTDHGPRLALVLTLFIMEHTYRKSQFSLPLGSMSNAAKAKAGIWTD